MRPFCGYNQVKKQPPELPPCVGGRTVTASGDRFDFSDAWAETFKGLLYYLILVYHIKKVKSSVFSKKHSPIINKKTEIYARSKLINNASLAQL